MLLVWHKERHLGYVLVQLSKSKVNLDICKAPLNTIVFSKALTYGNTQFYLQTCHSCLCSPAAEHHRRLAGTHFTVPQRVEGWVNLGGWLYTKIKLLPYYPDCKNFAPILCCISLQTFVAPSLTRMEKIRALVDCVSVIVWSTWLSMCEMTNSSMFLDFMLLSC